VQGIGSARELVRLCEEHIAFQWLCGGVGMNARTLADFRLTHGAVLEQLLVDSFAQDGVRVRAAAGAASFRRHSRLEVCQQEAEERVRRLRAELEQNPGAASRRQVAARQRAADDRARRVKQALAVENSGSDMGKMAPMSDALGEHHGQRRASTWLMAAMPGWTTSRRWRKPA
jgi:hypothetical protein